MQTSATLPLPDGAAGAASAPDGALALPLLALEDATGALHGMASVGGFGSAAALDGAGALNGAAGAGEPNDGGDSGLGQLGGGGIFAPDGAQALPLPGATSAPDDALALTGAACGTASPGELNGGGVGGLGQ